MFDLTQPLRPDIPRFPGDPEVHVEVLAPSSPWQVSLLTLGTHSGTHMDAPRHRFPDGAAISDFPVERMVGCGLVLDARGAPENEAIPASVLDPVRDRVWPGWFALIHTGWDRFWPDDRYFRHPYLSPGLARELVDLGAGLVGIDALSVDSTADEGSGAHEILLGSNRLIVENLCNLHSLDPTRVYTVACLPLPLHGADGAPARVVAWPAT